MIFVANLTVADSLRYRISALAGILLADSEIEREELAGLLEYGSPTETHQNTGGGVSYDPQELLSSLVVTAHYYYELTGDVHPVELLIPSIAERINAANDGQWTKEANGRGTEANQRAPAILSV